MTEKFIIISEPRAGAKLLKAFLNNFSKDVYCEDELFHNRSIRKNKEKQIRERNVIINRDRDSGLFIQNYYREESANTKRKKIGFLFTLGCLYDVLDYVFREETIKIIYLRRENKLAQFESIIKAKQSKIWMANEEADAENQINQKIVFDRARYLNVSGELQVNDALIQKALSSISNRENRVFELDYVDLFTSEKLNDVLKFLSSDSRIKTEEVTSFFDMHKLGSNNILSRFENTAIVTAYFSRTKNLWLEDEIKNYSD